MPRVGAAVRRLEDPRLLRGQASLLQDPELPRKLPAAFLRSEYPHARVRTIATRDALQTPGVTGVFSAYELGARTIHAVVSHPALRPCAQPILADGFVRYVGEPIAAVLG